MCDISAASAFLDLQKVVFGLRLVSHLLCGQKPLFPRVVPVHARSTRELRRCSGLLMNSWKVPEKHVLHVFARRATKKTCDDVRRRATTCDDVRRRATPCNSVRRRAKTCQNVQRRATTCPLLARRGEQRSNRPSNHKEGSSRSDDFLRPLYHWYV
jgi:hypothetical protein